MVHASTGDNDAAGAGASDPARLTARRVQEKECRRIGRTPEVGLALSGGGIRSATFALGLVQALKKMGLFQCIDYISTVSGGGYTGGWLYALQRRGQLHAALDLDGPEPRQVRFLRAYSNYLTPKLGLFSGDTWAVVGTVARNLIITFSILSLSLIALLYVPWLIHLAFGALRAAVDAGRPGAWDLVFVAAGLLALAIATSAWNMARPLADGTWEADPRHRTSRSLVQLLVVAPILVAMALLAACLNALPAAPREGIYWDAVVPGSVGYMMVWAFALAIAYAAKAWTSSATQSTAWGPAVLAWLKLSAFALLAGAIGAVVVTDINTRWLSAGDTFVELRMPLLVLGFLLALTAHIGLAGTQLSEETREWWARVGGQVLLSTLMLSGLVAIAVHGPGAVRDVQDAVGAPEVTNKVLAVLWAAITGTGILAGRSGRTSNGGGSRWLELAGRIAPAVFVVGYLVILSVWLTRVRQPDSLLTAPLYMAGFGALAWWLSRRADLNEFSMHALYRNRLVQCYLGASNGQRQAHPFHGFDPNDDLSLAWPETPGTEPAAPRDETRIRPYPLFNAAINLVGGKNLAWQQRKAASFVFTPDVCGYEYRVDEQNDRGSAAGAAGTPPPLLSAYSSTVEHRGTSLSLGLAMATSGAAASPNMGYHTSPTLSFLMTVFNVRLGWWLRNPRYKESWTSDWKWLSLNELLSELLGLTTDERNFVYLSDGGHFENLGLYELVRRRCPFIIACDAGQDGHTTFEDLGNAIEKCRADFGIDIAIDVGGLRPADGRSGSHCAVGTIHYEQVESDRPPGTLLYLKSSLTGDEPSDVLRYGALHPEFPHQSTSDQFFSESQFESYRALGYHIGRRVFDVVRSHTGTAITPTEIFRLLRQRWTPSAPAPSEGISRYSRVLNDIWTAVRASDDLRFLDGQIFPEWASLMATGRAMHVVVPPRPESAPINYWLPDRENQRRAGFYVCNEMLQLMEDVYLEFRLDDHYDHIDNRGWMNLFQHWAWSGMLCATWAITAATYDPRFQRFCAERLDLRPGRVRLPRPTRETSCELPDASTWTSWDLDRRAAEKQAWQTGPVGLNFWEVELVAYFLDKRTGDDRLSLHAIRVGVESPRRSDGNPFEFTVGYLILAHEGDMARLVHMRVQNHLRKMGVGGAALRCLLADEPDGWGLPGLAVQVPAADPTPESVSLDEALPRPDTARRIKRWINALANAHLRNG